MASWYEEEGIIMSDRKKRRERKAPMPAQGAGLLRFFEEETEGVKVKPEILVVLTAVLIISAILLATGLIIH